MANVSKQLDMAPHPLDVYDDLTLTLHRTKAIFLALPYVKPMEEAVSLAGLGEELCGEIEKHADALYRSSAPKPKKNGLPKLTGSSKQDDQAKPNGQFTQNGETKRTEG